MSKEDKRTKNAEIPFTPETALVQIHKLRFNLSHYHLCLLLKFIYNKGHYFLVLTKSRNNQSKEKFFDYKLIERL